MIQLSPRTRILVAVEPIDLRKGFDSLVALCKQKLAEDPMTGTVFVFTNRSRTHIRLLTYDGQGLWICTKRLSSGRFPYWVQGGVTCPLTSEQLFLLLRGGNPTDVKVLADWKQLPT